MFYSNNDNYMQDLYFYNQTPNMMNTYNPNMNNFNNGVPNMMNGMCVGQNPNMFNNNMNSLYPSIYRIISPVVSRVIQNSNYQFLNEDVLNNMVDTVYNIVEGQINYDEEDNSPARTSSQTEGTTASNSSTNTNNSSSTTTRTSETRTTQTTTSTRHNRNDSLLRDIIKILILKELLSRNNQMQNGMQFNQSPYYSGQNYNNMNF